MAGGWELLKSVTTSGNTGSGETITTGTIAAAKFLKLAFYGVRSSNQRIALRFNGDGADTNKYAVTHTYGWQPSGSISNGTNESLTSQDEIVCMGYAANDSQTTIVHIFNPSQGEKLCWVQSVDDEVANPSSYQGVGKWASNDQITSIQVVNKGSGNIGSGATLTVWGSDDATLATSDASKDSITNVPEGTRYEETDTRKIFRREIGALDNDTGLMFRYKFDEASGNVINYGSVADADLTVSGLTRDVSTPSGIGNGMSTPNRDSNDYAENTSRVNDYKFMHDGTAKWSVTFWAYLTDVPENSPAPTETACIGNVWTDDNGIGFTIRWAMDQSPASSTSCRLQTFIADGDAGMPLNDQSPNGMMPELNAWHFYCVTYDPTLSSNHLTVSRDAATSGTGFHQGDEDHDGYSSSNPTRKTTYFARPTSSYDLGMGGRLAEVTIWKDKILTQAEKVALYASGNGTSKISSSWKEKGTA